MITTSDLIDALARKATPVKRLRPPTLRAAIWLGFAVLIVALLAADHGFRADLADRLRQPMFVLSLGASMMTGVLAAIAAFLISLPDRSPLWALLPLPALLVWVSTIGYGCLTDWVSIQPDGVRMGETVRCFATLVLTSLPLSFAMLVMVRHAAPLRPVSVTLIGALAVAAITSTALSLLHELDATIMILTWNLATAALIVAVSGALGRHILSRLTPDQALNG